MNILNVNLNQFEEYRDALALKTRLLTERTALETQFNSINANLISPRNLRIEDEVRELLGDGRIDRPPAETKLRVDLDDVRHQLVVVREALTLQDRKIDEITATCSKRICEEIRPKRIVQMGRLYAATEELAAALQEEFEFADQLVENGINFAGFLPRPRIIRLGRMGQENSTISSYVRDIETDYPELTSKATFLKRTYLAKKVAA
jgi:hypothetical protein